jgi:hypothetical protein
MTTATEDHPPSRLYGVPSLIIRDREHPADLDEADQLARNIMEEHITDYMKTRPGMQDPARRAAQLKKIMGQTVLGDDEDGEGEEYPVSKPKPVSPPTIHTVNVG